MPPLAIIGLGLAAAGTATSVVGQVKAGNAAQQAGEFNANVATEQATIKENQQRLADQRVLSTARANAGASGVEGTSGSPLDVMAESARQAEMNALIIRRGGVLDAYAQRKAGNQAQSAARIGAVGSLLTGGASIAKQGQELLDLNSSGSGGTLPITKGRGTTSVYG
jgi:hypothetical protein